MKYHIELSISRQRAEVISREAATASDGCADLVEITPGYLYKCDSYNQGANNDQVHGESKTQTLDMDHVQECVETQNQDSLVRMIDVRVLIDGEEVDVVRTRRGKPIGNWDDVYMTGRHLYVVRVCACIHADGTEHATWQAYWGLG